MVFEVRKGERGPFGAVDMGNLPHRVISLRQKAIQVTRKSSYGRLQKPQSDIPSHAGDRKGYYALLTNDSHKKGAALWRLTSHKYWYTNSIPLVFIT